MVTRPRCHKCNRDLGMYTSPCPGAPTGAMRHYCTAEQQEVVTHASTLSEHVFVCMSLIVSRLNGEIMAREYGSGFMVAGETSKRGSKT